MNITKMPDWYLAILWTLFGWHLSSCWLMGLNCFSLFWRAEHPGRFYQLKIVNNYYYYYCFFFWFLAIYLQDQTSSKTVKIPRCFFLFCFFYQIVILSKMFPLGSSWDVMYVRMEGRWEGCSLEEEMLKKSRQCWKETGPMLLWETGFIFPLALRYSDPELWKGWAPTWTWWVLLKCWRAERHSWVQLAVVGSWV